MFWPTLKMSWSLFFRYIQKKEVFTTLGRDGTDKFFYIIGPIFC